MYSNAVYGNEVVYIMCNSEELDAVPVMDGQIIVLRNSSGMYYDVGSTRHHIGGVEVVSGLPNKGKRYTLYVVLEDGKCENIYLCTGKTYVPLIPDAPEQVISVDAPDTIWEYIRVNGVWKRVLNEFRFEPDETLSSNLERFDTWSKDISPNTTIHLVGEIPYQSERFPLTFSKPGLIYDFQDCDVYTYILGAAQEHELAADSEDWALINIVNSYGVKNMKAERVNIEFGSISDENILLQVDCCWLRDSRISFHERTTNAVIKDCYFSISDSKFTPIVESGRTLLSEDVTLDIDNNLFSFPRNTVGCAFYGISTHNYNIRHNCLHSSVMLYRMTDQTKIATLSAPFMPKVISNNGTNSDYAVISINKNNALGVLAESNQDWKFLKWVCHNKWVRNFLSLGDVLQFKVGDSVIYLGVAQFNYTCEVTGSQLQPNVIFEINPKRCTTYSDVNSPEFKAIGKEYFTPICRCIPGDEENSQSMLLAPMMITDVMNLEEVDLASVLAQTHFYLTTKLAIYCCLDGEYNLDNWNDGSSKWALYDSESVNRCFLTPDSLVGLDSESFDNSSKQHFAVSYDGNIITTTSLTNSEDVRLMIAL